LRAPAAEEQVQRLQTASGLCEHQRQRSTCKACGGSSLCEHQWRRSTCKDCGGSGLCEHQRQKNHCKDCGGSSLCEHQRRRSRYKDCRQSAASASTSGRRACVKIVEKSRATQQNRQKESKYRGGMR